MMADRLVLEASGTAYLKWGNACESHTHQGIWRPRGAQVGGRADAYPGPWRGHRPGACSIRQPHAGLTARLLQGLRMSKISQCLSGRGHTSPLP